MKKIAKKIVVSVLGWQVRRLRNKKNFLIVAVAGSIGKTSTKFAIASVLSQKYKVRLQEGNYNDVVTVPLVFFGKDNPPRLTNPGAWLRILIQNERDLRRPYDFDVVVVELGTDFPGNLAQFKTFIDADMAILTAITPEHMEFFTDLDAVAREELTIADLTKQLIINADLCAKPYLEGLTKQFISYATRQEADYRITGFKYHKPGYDFMVMKNNQEFLKTSHELIAETQLYSVCAAVAVGSELGMVPKEIEAGIRSIKPVSGRMQHLKGINNSIIIDDTYNASPEAMKAALDTVYKLDAPQKVAILGNMNELGTFSEQAHKEIGNYCDPKQLDMVITIGPEANQYLAPAARAKGCDVHEFTNPYQAGSFLKENIKKDALILAKGSQNGVFAEETIKALLANPEDSARLVRQTPRWLKTKQKQFSA
jgi:UDP-N-acetylmuramoyl-tripeptide--D-alanyl-D-alanine ligase